MAVDRLAFCAPNCGVCIHARFSFLLWYCSPLKIIYSIFQLMFFSTLAGVSWPPDLSKDELYWLSLSKKDIHMLLGDLTFL